MLNGKIFSITHEFLYVATIDNDNVVKTRRYKLGKVSPYSRQRLSRTIPLLSVYRQPVYICKV